MSPYLIAFEYGNTTALDAYARWATLASSKQTPSSTSLAWQLLAIDPWTAEKKLQQDGLDCLEGPARWDLDLDQAPPLVGDISVTAKVDPAAFRDDQRGTNKRRKMSSQSYSPALLGSAPPRPNQSPLPTARDRLLDGSRNEKTNRQKLSGSGVSSDSTGSSSTKALGVKLSRASALQPGRSTSDVLGLAPLSSTHHLGDSRGSIEDPRSPSSAATHSQEFSVPFPAHEDLNSRFETLKKYKRRSKGRKTVEQSENLDEGEHEQRNGNAKRDREIQPRPRSLSPWTPSTDNAIETGGGDAVFLENLPPSVAEKQIHRIASKFGTVRDIYVSDKRDTFRMRVAWISMSGIKAHRAARSKFQGMKHDGCLFRATELIDGFRRDRNYPPYRPDTSTPIQNKTTTQVVVRHLGPDTTLSGVEDWFAKADFMASVIDMRAPGSAQTCIVRLPSPEACARAIELLDGASCRGEAVHVCWWGGSYP